MCVGGPPKPMQPMRPHSRRTAASPGALTAGATRPVGTARPGCRTGRRAGSAARPGRSRCRCGRSAPAARSRSTSASMSSTIRWMRFQPPGAGVRPSGIGRPAELVGPLSSSRRLPRMTSAKAGAAFRPSSKPKLARVEVDRRVDVVDHVADADEILGHVQACLLDEFQKEGDALRRARPPCARTRGRSARRCRPPAPGRGCSSGSSSGWPGSSGQTSRTRSHSVITLSKRRVRELADVLGAPARQRSMPPRAHDPHGVRVQGLRVAPGAERLDRPAADLLGQRLGHLRARAVARAQEEQASGLPARSRAARRSQPGVQRRAGRAEQLAAAREIEAVVGRRGRRPRCGACPRARSARSRPRW